MIYKRILVSFNLYIIIAFCVFFYSNLYAEKILVPMDDSQTDHLKAYGLAYYVLDKVGIDVEWLLNYRYGSFLFDNVQQIQIKAKDMGVKIEIISDSDVQNIYQMIEEENMEKVLLEKAPKIMVYSPNHAEPWDDAVRLALEYAEIPYKTIYDEEIIKGELTNCDWLHLHHEDFTGQFGKFYGSYRFADWYRNQTTKALLDAQKLGYSKVWQLKHAVARKIRQYVIDGGFLFAMCSACDTIDLALAANGTDIVPEEIDGDPVDPLYESKLDFSQTFAFHGFKLIFDPYVYEFSDIDISNYQTDPGTFRLFEFSAKIDPIPTMLTQCHRNVIDGFFGQTTAFRKTLIKSNVTILAECSDGVSAKYIRGDLGKGCFAFYGGHDPADVSHIVGEGPTRLELHKNSPGYRLILNNVLFPAAKKKEKKT